MAARKPKANGSAQQTDAPTVGHNVKQINDTINSGFDEILKLDRQAEAAIAKHVQATKDARTAKFREMKADTNVTIKVLNAHYNLIKMKSDADMDEEGGEETVDMMRITHNAVVAGGQLSWFASFDEGPKGKAPSFTSGGSANP